MQAQTEENGQKKIRIGIRPARIARQNLGCYHGARGRLN